MLILNSIQNYKNSVKIMLIFNSIIFINFKNNMNKLFTLMRRILFICFQILVLFSTLQSQEVINKGKISGYMFGDLFYNAVRDTGILSIPDAVNGGAADVNGARLRRIYFTYDYDISESFTSRFRLEADQISNTSDGKIGVFVKDAYLTWKNIFPGSDLTFGIQPSPAFEVSESVWGGRFLEKTILDLRKIVSSRDIGISLKGKIDKKGLFNYWLMFGDGSGNKPEVDKYKRYYGHIQILPLKHLYITLYADFNSRPEVNDPLSVLIPKSTLSNNSLTYAFFAGYKEKNKYSIGLESFINKTQNGFSTACGLKDKNAIGISAFASYTFSNNLSVLGRYDYFDPNTDSEIKGDSRNFIIFSINYKPNEKVTISPNVFIETYESLPDGREIKPSVTPQLTFFYILKCF